MAASRRALLRQAGLYLAALAGCASTPESRTQPRSQPSTSPSATTSASTPATSTGETTTHYLTADTERVTPTVDAATLETLVRGNTAFALALHRQLLTKGTQTNLLTAPYSVSVALAMTYAGARGETRTQMADALHFGVAEDTLHPAFNTLDRRIDPPAETSTTTTTTAADDGMDDPGEADGRPFSLNTVNAIWGQSGFPWRDAYIEVLARQYGAGLHLVNFRSKSDRAAARQRINDWVATQTRNTIQNLFPKGSFSRLTRLVLANAVYFTANWKYTFPEERTEQRPFTALDGSTTDVPMMVQDEHKLPYTEQNGVKAVELPYVGGDVGMVILLPPAGELRRFEQSLTVDRLQTVFEQLGRTDGTLRLPKFAYDSSLSLPKALAELGMPRAFDKGRANFRDMYHYDQVGLDLFIDDVKHKTHIAVDEYGTEAAAATGVEIVLESASQEPFDVTVNRPFLFCLRHRPTSTVLFLGRVGDASAARPDS